MSVLLIDFEATGLDTKTSRTLEIGAMVVHDDFTVHEGHAAQVSTLVWESGYPALIDEVKKVTGITEEMLLAEARPPLQAFSLLGDLVTNDIKHVVAFNRAYDENLFREEMFRHELTMDPRMNWLLSSPWLCAMVDIEKNYEFKSWRLAHLALEYGVTVNPKILHRAINDVELMRQMLVASGTTIKDMYDFQQMPWVYVRALCKKPWEDNGESTAKAKLRGYSWEQCKGDETGKKFDKCWVKRVKQKYVALEEQQAPFQVRVIPT